MTVPPQTQGGGGDLEAKRQRKGVTSMRIQGMRYGGKRIDWEMVAELEECKKVRERVKMKRLGKEYRGRKARGFMEWERWEDGKIELCYLCGKLKTTNQECSLAGDEDSSPGSLEPGSALCMLWWIWSAQSPSVHATEFETIFKQPGGLLKLIDLHCTVLSNQTTSHCWKYI